MTPATRRLAELVAAVADDDLTRPTPCEAMTVAALLDHIGGLSEAFRMAATKESVGAEPQVASADATNLDPEFRTTIPAALDALATAWNDPAAHEGTTVAGPVEMPAEVAALVAVDEVVVHGWDLARAIGQPFDPDPACVEAAEAFVAQFSGPGTEDQREGLFGPELTPPPGASPLDRLLAMTGRDPAWAP